MNNKLYTILVATLLFCSNILAQCPYPIGISTNPLNPSNTDPSAAPIGNPINTFQWFNTTSTPIVGGFIWDKPEYKVYVNGSPATADNPFNKKTVFSSFAGSMSNDGVDRSDYKPEDGWELIKADLGYYANGLVHGNNQLYYIILYNKHQGIMRFLGLWPNANLEVDYVELKMRVLRKKEVADFPITDFINKVPNLKPNRLEYYYNDDLKVNNIFSVNKDEIRPLDQKI